MKIDYKSIRMEAYFFRYLCIDYTFTKLTSIDLLLYKEAFPRKNMVTNLQQVSTLPVKYYLLIQIILLATLI